MPNELENNAPIGTALMDDDGTIILDLRAEGPAAERGSARVTYRPEDKEYKEVLTHLGGLLPGEEKLVPPWPDDE